MIEQEENMQNQLEEQGAEYVLVEQSHGSEQQQKIYPFSSFQKDYEIKLKWKAGIKKKRNVNERKDQLRSREDSIQSKIH